MIHDMERIPYMNVQQAAQELGITPGAVRDAIARGKITAIKQAGTEKKAGYLLIHDDEIARYRTTYLGTRGKYRRDKGDAE